MRYALAAAALVAGALAVPYQKRDVVVDYDYVTVTNVVTVTAGAEATTSVEAAAAVVSSSSSSKKHHHWWTKSTVASSAAATSVAPAPSSSEAPSSSAVPAPSSYEAPSSSAAPTTATSTYVAPTTSTSVYVAPTATSKAPSSTWVAPSSSKAPASSAPASSAAGAAPTDYAGLAKYHHNLHRSNHSAPAIEWDDALAATAEKIASSCVYAHDVDTDGGGYGQNIAAGVESNNISAIITDLFYNGEVGWYDGLYGKDQPDMTNFEKWGHFSQIVWVDTTHVGCATYDCTNKGLANVGTDVAPFFTVCNYKNPGNYANEYGVNVLKSKNKPTAQWNAGSS
ncbi:hypothetical protein LTR97_004199 [Elasticomyces elasticus]|uniref:SCP domain-containing protein n=1 Tax=Elasticomyces elasticus TaxID=574655 RepID=A0AAN8A416_9PEZI|nr:hypothetical protein LTR97_004199 [Elasticomyces elasticus]